MAKYIKKMIYPCTINLTLNIIQRRYICLKLIVRINQVSPNHVLEKRFLLATLLHAPACPKWACFRSLLCRVVVVSREIKIGCNCGRDGREVTMDPYIDMWS